MRKYAPSAKLPSAEFEFSNGYLVTRTNTMPNLTSLSTNRLVLISLIYAMSHDDGLYH